MPGQDADLSYSLRRHFIDEFYARHMARLSSGSQVLDLGGERVHKRGRFNIERYDFRVVYANLSTAKRPDVQADAAHLPLEDDCIDVVLCSELLEHVPDPFRVLVETRRVLRTDGIILISVPFLHRIHGDPHDYGRYTDLFWSENLTNAGFVDVEIEKQGLFWSVIVDMLRDWVSNRMTDRQRFSPFMGWAATKLIDWGKRRAIALEAGPNGRDHPFFANYTTGFGVRAVKP